MLEEMRIRGLGVIGEAVLEFGPGLTVVTGETGAGKTMVVTGIGLLLGARADAGAVRAGASAALVEGLVRVAPEGSVAQRAREAGAELDDETLVVARSVSAEGRSRAHLGGRSVPVGLLAELAPELIAVHGQADQIRLQAPGRQRDLLDRYAGDSVAEPMGDYVRCFDRLRAAQRELAEVSAARRDRATEAASLRQGLRDVEALDPQPGEDGAVTTELARLTHADTLRESAEIARELLSGDLESASEPASVVARIAQAAHAVEPGARLDPQLAELQSRLSELGYLATDIAGELAAYGSGVEADPARMAVLQDRLAALRALIRRYGDGSGSGSGSGPARADAVGEVGAARVGVDLVLDWARQAAERLAELDDDTGLVDRLEAELTLLRERAAGLADRLSQARARAAAELAERVAVELGELAMPSARLDIEVSQRALAGNEDSQDARGGLELADGRLVAFGEHGVDDVELLLSPHEGAPARPLSRGASGGELSRVMLALEVVLAGADPVPTFVFDEVDAGVGGRAAVEIGRRLAKLAEHAQVLVVTHLPQVAAYADRHLVVTKAADGSVTESGVTRLDEPGRVRELARMLAGQEESRSARAHAKELLAAARGEGR